MNVLSKCLLSLIVVGSPYASCFVKSDEPQKHALIIGVEKYDKAGFTNLNYAEDDAVRLNVILKKLGFQTRTLLGSSSGADKATLANIRSTIDKSLLPTIKKLNKQDIVVVFMAGHGQQKVVDGREDAFFCPTDAVTNQPNSWLSLSELTKQLAESRAQNNLVLIDACRNAVDRAGIDGKNVELIKDNMAIFFACKFGERSTESDELKHGLFTYYILQGLEGAAKDADGDVTWDNLVSYVKKRVSGSDANQHPNEVSNLQGESPVMAKFPILMPDQVIKPQPKIVQPLRALAGLEIPNELASKLDLRKHLDRDGIGLLNANTEEIVYVSVSESEVSKLGGDFDFTCEYRNDHATEFCLRSGASTRRFQVLVDRGIYIAGNVQQGYDLAKVFPRDKPWILKLSRKGELVRVLAISPIDGTEVPAQAFEFSGPIHEIRIGIKNSGLVFSATCEGIEPATPMASSDLYIERFATTETGSLPANWVASPPGGIGVTNQFGMPCLTRFTEKAAASIPNSILPMLAGNYVVECDFLVAGGGSHNPTSNFDLIAVAGKEKAWFPCNSFRGRLRIGQWESRDDKTKASAYYGSLFTRTTLRLEKQSKELRLMMVPINGTAPVVFHSAPALEKRLTAFQVGFSENKDQAARLYEIRIEKLK